MSLKGNSNCRRTWSDLTKATPANLSIVGPRYIGKSVLLREVAEHAATNDSSPFSLVLFWELGHSPPQSDAEFVSRLCEELRGVMMGDGKFNDHRKFLQEDPTYGTLKEVMDLLQTDESPVLMIWDGFDKPLSQGKLTGSLFGNLRDLFNGKRHKVITATRATQTALARNKQVEDSPFWNMFDPTPVSVGPFDQDDIAAAIEVAGLSEGQGGLKELTNWSGRHPVLLLSLLNELGLNGSKEFDNKQVAAAAKISADKLQEFLGRVWESFDTESKNVFLALSSSELANEHIGKDQTRFLTAGGFASKDGQKHVSTCRLLAEHVEGSRQGASEVARLFGSWDSYRNEIRSILELRVSDIPVVDGRLHRLVKQSLENIPEYPDDCLNHLTSIEDAALDIIWKFEFGQNKISQPVIAYWSEGSRSTDNIIGKMMEADDWSIPKDRFLQLAILQRLTGSKAAFDAKSKHVSKDTYVLLNAIHQFRNRSEHADGQPIFEGVAVSALLLCIELLGCLARELGGT